MNQAPGRAELEGALRAAGCRIDLDAALANPALARCLELTAVAMREPTGQHPSHSPSAPAQWATRLRRLAGDLDHQALRAGADDN